MPHSSRRKSTTPRSLRRWSPSSQTPRYSNSCRKLALRKRQRRTPRRIESSSDNIRKFHPGGAVAQLGARLDGIEEVVGSNPIGSTNLLSSFQSDSKLLNRR